MEENSSSSSNCYNGGLGQPVYRSELNTYPTTFVQANVDTFKQVVQMLTGSVNPAASGGGGGGHNRGPIRTLQKKQGFKLYERRNNNNGVVISPILPNRNRNSGTEDWLRYAVERLSPSILDFPSLALLSPVTPLTVMRRSSSEEEEEKAIAEKGYYLHPSPRIIDDDEPRLLPLFPVTSPRLSSE
ncbi:VQ motif-containing protein 19-like [Impatiens glandulifera]|uniref:VQ motif-containing protein 19-like n=1 Tax=Impatiens glandulifera TaxID=253017 RepID=UPI001FB0666C|nr:VQ motif-containing protein 19-like [Impatiens glandulifera]